jgi:hypothetical protein
MLQRRTPPFYFRKFQSLLLRKLRAKDIPTDRPWSAFRLPRAFAWEVIQAPCECSARQLARQWLRMGNAA